MPELGLVLCMVVKCCTSCTGMGQYMYTYNMIPAPINTLNVSAIHSHLSPSIKSLFCNLLSDSLAFASGTSDKGHTISINQVNTIDTGCFRYSPDFYLLVRIVVEYEVPKMSNWSWLVD